jgi:hypothetical protein
MALEYERHMSLRRTFPHLTLSETDLARIGAVVRAASDPPRFQIDVRSADNEDSFRTSDLGFFSSDAMPEEVSAVTISGSSKTGALRRELELRVAQN